VPATPVAVSARPLWEVQADIAFAFRCVAYTFLWTSSTFSVPFTDSDSALS
jgi:hypothetical protein